MMKPGIYRNRGAGWTRADGTRIENGDEFVPTQDELRLRSYKLRWVGSAEEFTPDPHPESEDPEEPIDVEDFHVGGGWYMIDGQKVQGREKAEELLRGQD